MLGIRQWVFSNHIVIYVPSGKHTRNDGKSPCSIGKSTKSMAIFNSYVSVGLNCFGGGHPSRKAKPAPCPWAKPRVGAIQLAMLSRDLITVEQNPVGLLTPKMCGRYGCSSPQTHGNSSVLSINNSELRFAVSFQMLHHSKYRAGCTLQNVWLH